MSERLCQCCGFREVEFDSPALLCEPCWRDWFDTGSFALTSRQHEWNLFFERIGKPQMAEDPEPWEEFLERSSRQWEWIHRGSRS